MSDKSLDKQTGVDYGYKASVLDERVHIDPNTGQKISIRDAISHYKTVLWHIEGFISVKKDGESYSETLKKIGFDRLKKFSEMFSSEFAAYLKPEDLAVLDDLVEKFNLFLDAGSLTTDQAKETAQGMLAVIYKYASKTR